MKESPSFRIDNTSSQAKGMEEHSGVELTPTQRGLYIALRESEKFSTVTDQRLMKEILIMSDGDVEKFTKSYPEIFKVLK